MTCSFISSRKCKLCRARLLRDKIPARIAHPTRPSVRTKGKIQKESKKRKEIFEWNFIIRIFSFFFSFSFLAVQRRPRGLLSWRSASALNFYPTMCAYIYERLNERNAPSPSLTKIGRSSSFCQFDSSWLVTYVPAWFGNKFLLKKLSQVIFILFKYFYPLFHLTEQPQMKLGKKYFWNKRRVTVKHGPSALMANITIKNDPLLQSDLEHPHALAARLSDKRIVTKWSQPFHRRVHIIRTIVLKAQRIFHSPRNR
jgi:hypothetical protein